MDLSREQVRFLIETELGKSKSAEEVKQLLLSKGVAESLIIELLIDVQSTGSIKILEREEKRKANRTFFLGIGFLLLLGFVVYGITTSAISLVVILIVVAVATQAFTLWMLIDAFGHSEMRWAFALLFSFFVLPIASVIGSGIYFVLKKMNRRH